MPWYVYESTEVWISRLCALMSVCVKHDYDSIQQNANSELGFQRLEFKRLKVKLLCRRSAHTVSVIWTFVFLPFCLASCIWQRRNHMCPQLHPSLTWWLDCIHCLGPSRWTEHTQTNTNRSVMRLGWDDTQDTGLITLWLTLHHIKSMFSEQSFSVHVCTHIAEKFKSFCQCHIQQTYTFSNQLFQTSTEVLSRSTHSTEV